MSAPPDACPRPAGGAPPHPARPLSWRAMSPGQPQSSDRGFEHRYGLVVTELGDGRATGRVEVRDQLKQPAGLVHGGVYAAIAESLAAAGTDAAGAAHGK